VTAATEARVTLAAFAATMLAALTLTPLIEGVGWLAKSLVVVGLTVAVGASMRRVTGQPLLVTVAEVAMLSITMTALFAGEAAFWRVLPGPEAISSLRDLFAEGLQVTRHDTPPVNAAQGLLLLASGGIGIVGLLVDLIAVTLRRPAAAGLPLLAVYCVPAAALPGGLHWMYFLLCGAGYLVLVGADAGDRVRTWGRVLSSSGGRSGGRSGGDSGSGLGGPLSGVRQVAAASLVIAAVVPTLVPGLGERILGRGNGSGSGQGIGTTINVVNPILNLRSDLLANSDKPVIRYTTDEISPQPLRIVTDDQFSGTIWQPSTGSLARAHDVRTGLPDPPGLSSVVPRKKHRARIEIGALAQTYLPLPYPTIEVDDIRGRWLWDARTLNVVGEGTTTRNLGYTATYLVVTPTPEQLAAAVEPPAAVVARYATLPKTLPPSIAQNARAVAGNGSPFDQAAKLQTWFRDSGGFTYSEKGTGDGRGDSGQDAVAAFLESRTGYCVHFASAMAVMARTLGIPARVAVGFLPGTPVEQHTYTIRLSDAHAWPELFFKDVGWVRFEPTPGTRTGAPPTWTLLPSATDPEPGTSTLPSAAPSANQPAGTLPDDPVDAAADTVSSGSSPWQWLHSIPWRVLAIVALVVLALAAPRLAADLTRRRRWRLATTPVQQAEAAWEALRLSLQDLGIDWAASWTPRALQLRLVRERGLDPAQEAAMARLVGDLERARYAPPGAPTRSVDALHRDIHAVVAGVRTAVAAGTRRRAAFFPASGLASIVGVARNVDAATNAASRQAAARASSLGSRLRSRAHG
jgi:transglutaminase-like putative cysteine protease